jgi:O-acetyl-ADP-ribose deacetylase (regulator of RNase III)
MSHTFNMEGSPKIKRKLLTVVKEVKKPKTPEETDYLVKEVNGDLLDAEEDAICQQCNCITTKALGLSKQIFDRFPIADDYKLREAEQRDIPGTIKIHKVPGENVVIVNMFAQYYPSKAKYSNDNSEKREKWFRDCLEALGKEKDLSSFAFPYNIGCGNKQEREKV